ncbi:GNAT family N-acetyltransferase [Streptomyces sp. NPDC051940]|uniref:GNAT family N-acetyltransferase n=1 Tax=Streptomyces sp. NPDC051940 TaxID=3155675 RepID=UPI003426F0AE
MSQLRIEQVEGQDALVAAWRLVHNTIIPNHQLTADEIRERSRRNHLEVAWLGDTPVGCATVRPPSDDPEVATVIARVLPAHRGRGYGSELYGRGLAKAAELGAAVVETLVLEQNEAGLRFALNRGFAEIERYPLPGDVIEIALGGRLSELRR